MPAYSFVDYIESSLFYVHCLRKPYPFGRSRRRLGR